jgi:hypothetical protein
LEQVVQQAVPMVLPLHQVVLQFLQVLPEPVVVEVVVMQALRVLAAGQVEVVADPVVGVLGQEVLVIHLQLLPAKVTQVVAELRRMLLEAAAVRGAADQMHRVQQVAQVELVLIRVLPDPQ